ncbi:MAG: biotin/lipoyl-binding protein [Bacteroidales bacterium]|nr:biotin/lipoyl-binding protein [Bacteroidales bacterium]
MKNYSFKINGKEYNVAIGEASGKVLSVNVNGTDYEVELSSPVAAAAPVAAEAAVGTAPSVANNKADAPSGASATSAPAPAAAAGAAVQVTSPLPGVIVEVSVKEGQAVKAGQKVAVLEAMKMENEIPAAKDGVITAILVNKGDSVLEGAPIVSIA